MKRFLPLILLFAVALSSAALATNPAAWWNTWALYFTNASTGAPETVTSSNPLPVSVISGGTSGGSSGVVTNLASDSDGNLKVHIASSDITLGITGGLSVSNLASDTAGSLLVNIASNTTVQVSSISVGIVLQDVRSIASDSNTILADITSGTAAPFWLIIRNTGVNKIHIDSVAPGDTTDYIAPGEQYGAIYCGSNVLNEKFRANSNGTSTWALTIRK